MQEQNFEKQVQQKMGELNLTPSAPVWQRVEQEIRKKKDRRRLVLWLFLFLLIGGGTTTWLLMDDNSGNQKNYTNNTTSVPSNNKIENSNGDLERKDESKDNTEQIENGTVPGINNKPDKTVNQTTEIGSKTDQNIFDSKEITTKQNTPGRGRKNNRKPEVPGKKHIGDPEPKIDIIDPDPVVIDPVQTDPKSKESVNTNTTSTDSLKTNNEKKITEQKANSDTTSKKDEKKKEAEVIVKKEDKNKKRWTIGLSAGAGISNVYSDLFTQTLVADNMSNSPGPGPGTGSGFGPPPPSKLETGLSYTAGISLKKELNDHFSFVTGFQYTMFSTKHSVGQEMRRDTILFQGNSNVALSNYYRNDVYSTTQSDYTNKYHFLELPLGIEYKPIRNLPLSIGAGVSIARMLNSNALVYDRTAGIYYEDQGNLNKTQMHAQGNISYTVWKHKKFSLSAGPYLQIGISSLVKDDKDRLFAAGLKTNISF